MASFELKGIEIKGICSSVPSASHSNWDSALIATEDRERIISSIGIVERRISPDTICTSDLCLAAAEKIIKGLDWKKEEIGALILVTQTPDYQMPATACILQDKLGLPQSCLAFDVNMGCSGYVYGLSIISSMLASAGIKKGLLLVGDTLSKIVSPRDKEVAILFGDAGTATALENTGWDKQIYNLKTDGSGKEAIIVPAGGSRSRPTSQHFEFLESDTGSSRRAIDLKMDGVSVFNFTIREVVKNINELLNESSTPLANVDSFVFHQANKMINSLLSKRLKVDARKIPSSLEKFGNTSCATIPVTMTTSLGTDFFKQPRKLLLSGFGVGLSWGSVLVSTREGLFIGHVEV
jgi:3-oxoacyl-[acyl-carrier-protein] synthase III